MKQTDKRDWGIRKSAGLINDAKFRGFRTYCSNKEPLLKESERLILHQIGCAGADWEDLPADGKWKMHGRIWIESLAPGSFGKHCDPKERGQIRRPKERNHRERGPGSGVATSQRGRESQKRPITASERPLPTRLDQWIAHEKWGNWSDDIREEEEMERRILQMPSWRSGRVLRPSVDERRRQLGKCPQGAEDAPHIVGRSGRLWHWGK